MRLAIRSLLVLCCLCGCGDGDRDKPPRLSADEAKAVATVKEAVNPLAASGLFSGAVQLSKDGRTLFERAYGLADRTRKVPNALDTGFRIGSINKMFTAVAVMQLVEAGKLDLEAPLGTYLRDYPNDDVADSVTIHHLLTHTGGTGEIFGPEFDAHRSELRALGDYVELYGERGLEFRPGSSSSYSNYGFILLGVVIERVTGQSYYEYVQEQVYEPAGMTRTGSLPEGEDVEGRAIGYMTPLGSTEWAPNTNTLPYRGTSAGGGYSTVGDLTRFAQALLGHQLLSAESTKRLITGKVDSDLSVATADRYAYGFQDARDAKRNGWVGHGGAAPGMNGDLRIYPKSGYVVAVLANLDPPAAQNVSGHVDWRLPQG